MYQSNELTNKQKAAILLITLGPEASSQIFKYLREDEIDKITLEIANQHKIPQDQKDKILTEFHHQQNTHRLEFFQFVAANIFRW